MGSSEQITLESDIVPPWEYNNLPSRGFMSNTISCVLSTRPNISHGICPKGHDISNKVIRLSLSQLVTCQSEGLSQPNIVHQETFKKMQFSKLHFAPDLFDPQGPKVKCKRMCYSFY